MTSRSNPVKRIIKRSLQHIAASFGRHTRPSKEPQLLLLMYHRILPGNDPRAQREEPGMIVTPESFKMHMGILKQYFDIVHFSEWIALKNSDTELPARACAITFDDGWADNYEFAFPILQEMGIPATIFLVSDMVGKNQQFWPERLAQLLTNIALQQPDQWSNPVLDWILKCPTSYTFTSTAPSQHQLSELIAAAKSYSDEDIHQRLDLIEEKLQLASNESRPSILNWQQINEMCATGLIEAGSHTCNHIRLTDATSHSVLQHEIIDSKTKIENKTGRPVKTFCYPNGDFSDNALSLVMQHYSAAVTTKNGWNSTNTNDYLLHRIGVHEDISSDKTSFLARLSGWL